MERWLYIVVLAPFVGTAVALGIWFERQTPRTRVFVRDRLPSEQDWSNAYSTETLPLASAVLDSICDAFVFKRTDKWRLRPNDKHADIYAAPYPPNLGLSDALEHAFLLSDLCEQFNVPEGAVASMLDADPTIQDLIAACVRHTGHTRTQAEAKRNLMI